MATQKGLAGSFSYPKVNIEVAGASKLPITGLKGDGHLVFAVKGFVVAFDAVGGQDDVVRARDLEAQRRQGEERPRGCRQMHCEN